MSAVAAGVVIPPVWSLGAVAKVPTPSGPCELIEGKQLDVGIEPSVENFPQHLIAHIHIEIFNSLARAIRIRAPVPMLVLSGVKRSRVACLEVLRARLLEEDRLPRPRGVIIKNLEGCMQLFLVVGHPLVMETLGHMGGERG
mgnify:CR=1 FL=1